MITNGVLGLAGEAGECCDIVKKYKYQGHELDKEHLKDELGDVLWYIAETASGLGITLEEVAEYKLNKLHKRFNGEKFISRYFDSILEQTYKNIEVIFINDGSTDTTEKIVEQYIPMFNKYGIEFIYIYQENKGQAAALNNGLKKFSGDYLTWPDSDDILTKDSIEKKVFFLENNKQYGLVRSGAKVVLENNLHDIIGYLGKNNKNKFKEDLFLDYIIENDVWFAPGCFMIRADNFLEVNPMREIYEGRGGQNWQMLLPLMYKYKCGYIDEELYIYVIRDNSHSHDIEGFEQEYKRCMEHEKILINCIKNIDLILQF